MRCKAGGFTSTYDYRYWRTSKNWNIFNHNKHKVFGVFCVLQPFLEGKLKIHCCWCIFLSSPEKWEFLLEASFFTIYFIVFMVSWIAIRTLRVHASRCSEIFPQFCEDAFGFGIFAPFVPVLAKSFQMTARNIAGANFFVHFQWSSNGKLWWKLD